MKLKLEIPENLNEIKLYQYQKFLKIDEPTNEDVLKCFLDLTDKEINSIKLNDVEDIANEVSEALKEEPVFTPVFKLNGVKYGFIPKLDDITYGENKDVTTYLNSFDNMHKAMAVLYRPILSKLGNKYIIEDYEGSYKYSDEMLNAPLGVVMGAMVFFYNLTNDLLKAIPSYLEREIMMEQTQGVLSVKNGEDIQNSIHLLKETLEDLMRLQN
jgi:hypothetical protein